MNNYRSKKRLLIMVGVIFFSSFVICFVSMKKTQAQQANYLTDNLVYYLGSYVFNYPRCNPPNFEKIRWIVIEEFSNQDIDNPKTDEKGYTQVDGYIETIDDEKIKFKKATLKKNSSGKYEEFEFETEKLNGIHFTFKGRFLNKPTNDGGVYTKMTGNLTKYKNGEWAAFIEMAPFSKDANM